MVIANQVSGSPTLSHEISILMFKQIVFTVYLAAQTLGWKHGLGQHEARLTPEDRSIALMVSNNKFLATVIVRAKMAKWWLVCFLLYIICVCFFKVSVSLFLLRIAVDRPHVWMLRMMALWICVCGTAYLFMAIFQCQPPYIWWTESPRAPGKCWDDKVVLGMDILASIFNCTADWALVILPIFVLKSLQMERRTKIMVGCLLSFAAVGSTATFIRIFFLPRLLQGDDFLCRLSGSKISFPDL